MVPAVLVDRQRGLLGVVVVAPEPGRPAHDQLADLADPDVLAGLRRDGADLDVPQWHAARRHACLERVVRLAQAGERARLGAAEARDLRRVRQALLHRDQRRRHADVDHEPDPAQVGSREAGVVEHAEPDRLEGGEGDRAALVLELVEGDTGLEVRHLQRRAAGREGTCEDRDAADVEERERRPEPVLGRQVQPLGDPLSLRHDRRVPVHAALRVGGGARRVEHQPVVVATDLRQRGGDGRGVDALRARHERRVLRVRHDPARLRRVRLLEQAPRRWARATRMRMPEWRIT